jgi:hypothetical protein
MAWQEDHAGWTQIAAKAVLKPIARTETSNGTQRRITLDHALTALLGGSTSFFKRRITTNRTLPQSSKVEESRRSILMIAENPGVEGSAKTHLSLARNRGLSAGCVT